MKYTRIVNGTLVATTLLLIIYFIITPMGQHSIWSVQYLVGLKNQVLYTVNSNSIQISAPPDSHIRGRTWLGQAALDTGEFEQASLEIAKDVINGEVDALRLQGEIFAADEDLEAALEIWQQIGDVHLIVKLGSELRQAGHLTDAMRAFQAAYEIDQEKSASRLASFLWRQLDDTQQAENILSSAVNTYTKSPNRPEWLNELGDLYQSQKQWDAAEIAYTAALDIDPRNAQTYVKLGWLFYDGKNDLDQAISSFEQAIEFNESYSEGYYAMARVLYLKGRHQEAKPWFKQALALRPDAVWWHVLQVANARKGGDQVEAFSLAQTLVQTYPEAAGGYFELAILEAQANNLRSAQEAISQAISLAEPNVPSHYIQLAQTISSQLQQ